MVTCKKATLVRNYLLIEVYWPCAGRLSAVNAIGAQLRDPINSGLTQWRLAVLNIIMDAAAEIGRNPVCNRSPLVRNFISIFQFFSEEKSQLTGFELTSQCIRRLRGYQMSYQEKNKIKITIEKKKKKKRKHSTVIDPETLFMRNSELIYCPKTCIA